MSFSFQKCCKHDSKFKDGHVARWEFIHFLFVCISSINSLESFCHAFRERVRFRDHSELSNFARMFGVFIIFLPKSDLCVRIYPIRLFQNPGEVVSFRKKWLTRTVTKPKRHRREQELWIEVIPRRFSSPVVSSYIKQASKSDRKFLILPTLLLVLNSLKKSKTFIAGPKMSSSSSQKQHPCWKFGEDSNTWKTDISATGVVISPRCIR